ncbi:MAG TPA: hypothetical protein VHI71_11925 [Actinomycetota bacterium]|nr:hypothetical protein [Actinomycetota bacterium]
MTTKIRALRLRAQTERGPAGIDLDFQTGLTILRGDNSSGKSTTLLGIIFALGLEGTMTSRKEVPFPHVMTERVDLDGEEYPVLESYVVLEIENGAGEVVSLQRYAKSDVFSSDLVFVLHGPTLTQGGTYQREEYFVRRPGAATRGHGFHSFLEQFIGWQLPAVSSYDGSDTKLYLECVTPFFYVEQKQGWAGLVPRVPTYLRIREPLQRAAEFILDLDSISRERLVDEARRRLEEIERAWKTDVNKVRDHAERLGVELRSLPDAPSELTPATMPSLWVVDEDGDIPLQGYRATLNEEIQDLRRDTRPSMSVRVAAPEIRAELAAAEDEYANNVAQARALDIELSTLREQYEAIRVRLGELEQEERRLHDISVIRKLGGDMSDVITRHACPTCHQSLDEVESRVTPVLTLEENSALIHGQVETLEALERDTKRRRDRVAVAINGYRQSAERLRERIRGLKNELVAPSDFPSTRNVLRLAELERRVESLDDLEGERDILVEQLERHATNHGRLRSRLKGLRQAEESSEDAAKVQYLESSFKDQLALYGLSSLPVDEIGISQDTFRPTHEGFDLAFDLSASDAIRTKWAYLIAFLETSRVHNTNHWGVMIFDEPRQQSTAEMSFETLLRRASLAGQYSQQVIFATSEDPSTLASLLRDVPHALHDFTGGKLFRTINESR